MIEKIIVNGEEFPIGESGSDMYMTKENPTGTGSFSLNRHAYADIGEYSTAEGDNAIASGRASHAEGFNTQAVGNATHAEGSVTHAKGHTSHAEGANTRALGIASHTEGEETIASGRASHAQGRYNIEDTELKYADIVGNGTELQRSNAYTLDWEGNAWFASNVRVGNNNEKLVTESEIPTSLPANGGNAYTVNNHTVNADVPADAKFTDTVYNDTAVRNDITALNNRIDNAISSVTTDTEVIDIRVGTDGTTYPTAGAAVRGQVTGLKQDLADVDSRLSESKIDKPTTADNNKFPRAKNGNVEWVEHGLPTDEQTETAVQKWLNEHPEATTTVQDKSLTIDKLTDDTKRLLKNSYTTPEMFGAKGNGIDDDSQAIQDAINNCPYGGTVNFDGEKTYLISEPMQIPFKTNVNGNGCTILASSNLSGKYMFLINATTELDWIKSYPYDDQYFGNFEFKTVDDDVYTINGIFNAGSGTISNIISVGINTLVRCIDKYVDHMLVKNCTALDHGTTDYAFHSGYLGDTRQFDGLKCIALNEDARFHKGLYIGLAHRNVTVKNYIQGDISINSNSLLENIMMSYQGRVYVNGVKVVINGFYAVFTDEPRILINNVGSQYSYVVLNNAEFVRLRDEEYIPTTPVPTKNTSCIKIESNAVLELHNVFLTYQSIAINDRRVYARVTIDNEAYDTYNKMLNSNAVVLDMNNASYKKSCPLNAFGISAYALSSFSHWNIESGKYFYKAMSIMCYQRSIFNLGTSETSIDTINGSSAVGLLANNGKGATLRIMRGKTSGSYIHYADVPVIGNDVFIIDDGIFINGVKWKTIDFTLPTSTAYCLETDYSYNTDILKSVNTTKYVGAKNNDTIVNTASNSLTMLSVYNNGWHDLISSS